MEWGGPGALALKQRHLPVPDLKSLFRSDSWCLMINDVNFRTLNLKWGIEFVCRRHFLSFYAASVEAQGLEIPRGSLALSAKVLLLHGGGIRESQASGASGSAICCP